MKAATRRAALWGALASAVALAAWVDREAEDPPTPAPDSSPRHPARPGRPAPELLARRPAPALPAGGDLFPAQSWLPPPPPDIAVAAPPRTPALPFTYGGKLVEGSRVTVYLSANDHNFVVRVGDVLEGGWQLKSITPEAITFVYLPLKQEQSLPIGSLN